MKIEKLWKRYKFPSCGQCKKDCTGRLDYDGYTKHCKISFVIQSYKGCSNNVHAPNEQQKHEILSKLKEKQ